MANDDSRSLAPRTGTVARREFSGTEVARTAETAVSAAAAQARAEVEAMYVMALQRPRDIVAVEQKLIRECGRRGFAEAATYSIPRGGSTITGPSIRFAEAALRALGNVHVRTSITYEDEERRVGTVTVIDLEANVPLSAGFTIDKTIERRKASPKDTVLGERVNSTGQTVYRIAATEADVLMKQESVVARLRRNLILQLLPGDLRDEALDECARTLREGDAADPMATAKKLAAAFGGIGISTTQLRDYLGHAVDQVTPDEAKELRGIYSALRDGATTWSEVVNSRSEAREEKTPPSPAEQNEKGKLIGQLATWRLQDAQAYEAALAECKVQKGVAPSALDLEQLRKVARLLDTGELPGGDEEQKSGDDAERKQWVDTATKGVDGGEEA